MRPFVGGSGAALTECGRRVRVGGVAAVIRWVSGARIQESDGKRLNRYLRDVKLLIAEISQSSVFCALRHGDRLSLFHSAQSEIASQLRCGPWSVEVCGGLYA